ncbi:S8 family serine peptidase [Pelagibaculum spongiae]|nr:S8 family serine peptidase [Pelagibaculum spongiae]
MKEPRFYLSLSLIAILTACGQASETTYVPPGADLGTPPVEETPTPDLVIPPTSIEELLVDPDYLYPVDGLFEARQGQILKGALPIASTLVAGLNFAVSDAPEGLVMIDSGLGTFEFDVAENLEDMGTTHEMTYSISNGTEIIQQGTIVFENKSDPLFHHQWHLKNTGQHAFARGSGVVGEDITTSESIRNNYAGQGITIAVVDDGLQIDHPDLIENVVDGSLNLSNGSDNPVPSSSHSSHGTAVGGIIASRGWNNIGGRGVASQANLIGFNFIEEQSFLGFSISHGGLNGNHARIYNQSYGFNNTVPFSWNNNQLKNNRNVYHEQSVNGHDGKGTLYVKAAGNGNVSHRYRIFGFVVAYERANQSDGLPFQNANQDSGNANFYNTVVSAMNADGELSSYSSWGSNVFVSAPGGEYGANSEYLSNISNEPAMVTTDRSGCGAGTSAILSDYSKSNIYPFFNNHPENTDCDYTNLMNGTSSATPVTSGVLAVILGVNPNLTWRDARNILAKSAEKVNEDDAVRTIDVGGVDYVAHSGWVTNAAGHSFNSKYGFGRVNVDAAVVLAKSYDEDLGDLIITPWQDSGELDLTIAEGDVTGATHILDIPQDLIIEGVQIRLDAKHSRIPDLAVELISPSGTRSVVMTPNNALDADLGINSNNPDGYVDTLLLSNAFFNERSAGEWRIRLIDTSTTTRNYNRSLLGISVDPLSKGNNAVEGILQNWKIRVLGH